MPAADIINAGPGGDGADEFVQRYLGVPEGYAVPRAGPTPGGGELLIEPRFVSGDEYTPGWGGTEDVARMQQKLDRTGLYKKGDRYRLGVWDEVDATAYSRLLSFANQQGYDEEDAFRKMGELSPEEYEAMFGKGTSRSRGTGDVGGGSIARGLINQRMSEDDLRYLAQRTARKSLGRSLSDEELGQFSGAYTQMISAATQREASASALAESGQNATYQAATSPEVFLEQQAQKTDPTAFEARRQVGALRAIGGMLGELGKG
jgi:hypothetical protein